MTDDFGRVLLLDVARGIAIRMWKGTSLQQPRSEVNPVVDQHGHPLAAGR